MATHAQAKQIVERAVPGIDPAASLLVRAVACLEGTGYGDNWPRDKGEGSHNWGAITAGSNWKGATFEHRDSYYDAKTGTVVPYVGTFRAYPTTEAGAKDLYSVLVGGYPSAVELAREGEWTMVSEALYGYYRGTVPQHQAIAAHRGRLLECLATISGATGEPVLGVTAQPPIAPPPGKHPFVGRVLFLGTLAVLPVYLWLRKAHRNG
jgi:hypothetical protein